jgi:phosphoribosylformimino-5-aminoimidazole carboxamide ribotide isomerase
VELIAAIDLLCGQARRLRQGDFDRPTAGTNAVELARQWVAVGVRRLHLVDLEGARRGAAAELDLLDELARAAHGAAAGVRIQAGGGLRSEEAVEAVFDRGVDQAILGTAAIEDPEFLAACASRWPDRILASLDLRAGRAAVDGWAREAASAPLELAKRLLDQGAAALIVTDVERDGTLEGPNLPLLAHLRRALPDARVLAAGGVGTLDDLRSLRETGVDGAIVGLALLSGAIRLEDALALLQREEVS